MLWLIAALIVGFLIWVGFGFVALAVRGGVFACTMGDQPVGWTEEVGAPVTAAVIGGVLWAAGGVAAGRLPDRRRLMLLAYAAVYIVALIVFCGVIAPAIWGPFGCDPGPTWDWF